MPEPMEPEDAVPTPDRVAEVVAVVEPTDASSDIPGSAPTRSRTRLSRVLLVGLVVAAGLLAAALVAAPRADDDRRAADATLAASQDQLDATRIDVPESGRKVEMTRTEVVDFGNRAAIAAATLHELDQPTTDSDAVARQIIELGRAGCQTGFNAAVDRANALDDQVNAIVDRLDPQLDQVGPSLER